jgi:hypothetical protein
VTPTELESSCLTLFRVRAVFVRLKWRGVERGRTWLIGRGNSEATVHFSSNKQQQPRRRQQRQHHHHQLHQQQPRDETSQCLNSASSSWSVPRCRPGHSNESTDLVRVAASHLCPS